MKPKGDQKLSGFILFLKEQTQINSNSNLKLSKYPTVNMPAAFLHPVQERNHAIDGRLFSMTTWVLRRKEANENKTKYSMFHLSQHV